MELTVYLISKELFFPFVSYYCSIIIWKSLLLIPFMELQSMGYAKSQEDLGSSLGHIHLKQNSWPGAY